MTFWLGFACGFTTMFLIVFIFVLVGLKEAYR